MTQFRLSLQREPDDVFAHDALGVAFVQTGRLDEAMEQFERSVEVDAGDLSAHNNLANLLVRKGRWDEAISHLRKILEIQPSDAESRSHLEEALMRTGRLDEAIGQYEKSVELAPNNAEVRKELGDALLRRGRLAEAVMQYGKSSELAPQDVGILNRLAWVLATCPDVAIRDGRRAVELARRAEELTGGKNAMALTTLGASYAEAGEFGEAAAAARRALAIVSGQANANPGLVNALRAQIGLYEAGSPFRDNGLRNGAR
jgi:Flp pilus assembly protein TadD